MDFANFFLNFVSISEISLIIEFIKFKEVNNLYTLSCHSQEKILFHKIFNYNNVQAAVLDINQSSKNIPYSYNTIGVIVNSLCDDWGQILNYFPPEIAFKNQFKWAIFTNDLLPVFNTLANYSIEVDSDVTIAVKIGNAYELYEVFHKGCPRGELTIRNVGFWNTSLYMDAKHRRDMTGVVIKSPVVITDKVARETFLDYLSKRKKNQVDSLHKLKFFALLNYIREMYNFR